MVRLISYKDKSTLIVRVFVLEFLDTTLPFNFRLWLNTFYGVAATLFVVSYSTPIFIAVIIPIMVLYYFVQVNYFE